MLNRAALLVLLVVASIACGKSQDGEKKEAPAPTPPAPVPEQKPPTDTPPDTPAEPEGEVVKKLSEDLDGDGAPEAIVVGPGKVTIGSMSAVFEGEIEELSDIGVEVVDFDKSDKSRELAVSAWSGEDDLDYTLFRYDGKQLTSSSVHLSNANVPGDGTLVDTYANCGQHRTTVYKLVDGKLAKDSEKTSGKFDETQCAACPYVFVRGPAGERLVGEILRDVRGRSAETTQSLALPASAVVQGVLHVRVAELKPETTYVDVLYITAGDRTVFARDCDGAWCQRDASYEVLHRGDTRELVFEVGALAPGETVTLWATGYYVPDGWTP